ncbi:hypothetical protein C5167_006695 [Papaver somniferum]|uniref:Uncharacterized protein n=1 Tax=Papaver somniferum TaxID=3469 RepID=A0A4Y7JH66_PAPSO|nr:hypothetical protein C5167_006695 [Papaver somniferum]
MFLMMELLQSEPKDVEAMQLLLKQMAVLKKQQLRVLFQYGLKCVGALLAKVIFLERTHVDKQQLLSTKYCRCFYFTVPLLRERAQNDYLQRTMYF